jgi:PAS domain S-box-containing protein
VNRAGEIEFINAQGEKTFGYAREEVLGKSVDMFNPERVREVQAVYRNQLFNGSGRAEGGSETDLWGLRKDGTEFPLEFTLSPLDTKDGRVFLFALRDITERKKTEARFQALLESAPDAMVIVNSDGRIELANQQTEKLFGYSRPELVGQSVDILVPLNLRGGHFAHRDRFFASPKPRLMGAGLDLMALRKDGTQFPVEISLSPLEGPDGISVTAAIRDVTERKKAETRFRALLESAPDAMVIVNSGGMIELANLQTEKLFGYSRAELVGQSVDMLVPLDLRGGHFAHRDRFFASPKPRSMGAGFDLEARRKDGTLFPVEISLSPLEGPDGVSVTAAIRDVTERKKAENRFRALLESAPDAMVIVNSDGIIELINAQAERLFGYQRTELIGKILATLLPERLRDIHIQHRKGFFLNPKPRQMGAGLDLVARRRDGTEFPVEISLSPLEGPNGVSVTAAIRDVTERKQAAQLLAEKMSELHQSNEALEQFAHIASHDLQEPLRMVASYTQLLSRRYKGRLDADADEFIDFAVDGTQRMKRLIEDLLLYSRAGKGAPPVVEFDADGSLREAIGNLHAAIEESRAEVTSGPLPTLVAVESQLVQLLQNLIGNAIKYRGDRIPKVHVSAEAGSREWIFSVADNGIGIDPKYFDRIFQIFQRLHGRGEYEGTGIGLAICKRILQQQGERIWLESEPGKGSVFHFSLPMR